jgi:ADP-ribose pyrophosphatase YjhB (NUDIX family)
MTATKRVEELPAELQQMFLNKPDRLMPHGNGLRSPYFEIRPGVIVGKDAQSSYDRPLIFEKPSVMVVPWGRDKAGKLRIGLIRQKRPPSNDPMNPGDDHEPLVFAQTTMGYYNDGESLKQAALRERLEEAGKAEVIGFTELGFPYINVEPNTYATWHSIAFAELDLSSVDENFSEETEMIKSVTYKPADEIFKHIVQGTDETGAYYRGSGTTLGVLMIFFAWIFGEHPELFRNI